MLLLVLFAVGSGRCAADRTADGWPGQRDAFERLCTRVGICFFVALLIMLVASPARAEAPAETHGNWSYGPSLAASVVAVNLRTGAHSEGINAAPPLGACLGVTYLPADLGFDGCANLQLNSDKPNQYFGSLMIHWRDWFNGGFGLLFVQGQPWAPLLLIGGRWGFLQAGAAKDDDRPAERWD
jgi:hypothetical protein